MGKFGWAKDYIFPVWFALLGLSFLVLETRKLYRCFFRIGLAKRTSRTASNNRVQHVDGRNKGERLLPRTHGRPIYTLAEFNDKVVQLKIGHFSEVAQPFIDRPRPSRKRLHMTL